MKRLRDFCVKRFETSQEIETKNDSDFETRGQV